MENNVTLEYSGGGDWEITDGDTGIKLGEIRQNITQAWVAYAYLDQSQSPERERLDIEGHLEHDKMDKAVEAVLQYHARNTETEKTRESEIEIARAKVWQEQFGTVPPENIPHDHEVNVEINIFTPDTVPDVHEITIQGLGVAAREPRVVRALAIEALSSLHGKFFHPYGNDWALTNPVELMGDEDDLWMTAIRTETAP